MNSPGLDCLRSSTAQASSSTLDWAALALLQPPWKRFEPLQTRTPMSRWIEIRGREVIVSRLFDGFSKN